MKKKPLFIIFSIVFVVNLLLGLSLFVFYDKGYISEEDFVNPAFFIIISYVTFWFFYGLFYIAKKSISFSYYYFLGFGFFASLFLIVSLFFHLNDVRMSIVGLIFLVTILGVCISHIIQELKENESDQDKQEG